MHAVSECCPNISSLEVTNVDLDKSFPRSLPISCFTWIPSFHKLEKLKLNCCILPLRTAPEFDLRNIDFFIENPMTKLKEMKVEQIGAFFMDTFMSKFHIAFPCLSTFDMKYGNYHTEFACSQFEEDTDPLVNFWKLSTVLDVLESLSSSVKNVYFENFQICPVRSNESIEEIDQIFKSAFKIIKEKFSIESGNFKIIDSKYGFEITKVKMKPAILRNVEQVNGHQITEIIPDTETKDIFLKLRQKGIKKRKKSRKNSEKVVLSRNLIKKLYWEFVHDEHQSGEQPSWTL